MNDSGLLKLSLGVATIGLLGLFWYGQMATAGYTVAQLGQLIDQKVDINGTASSVFTSQAGHTFFQLSDETGQIGVVIFKSSHIDTSGLDNGVSIEVSGQVQEYQGQPEIIADSIRVSEPP